MDEEEKYMSELKKCRKEIYAVLEKYGVEINSDLFYDSSWIVLSVNGLTLYKNKFGRTCAHTYELKI